MKMDNIKKTMITKIKKAVKNIEANHVEINEKLEEMDLKIKESNEKTNEK